ncbi:YybH family protein [Saccharomonospora viridis]|uniref:Ketosteroid isomerase n=1 Tax=Saccharomonospora viridis TaxID=1852 RepID=A0A837D9D6_9PSEU|nr:nuclear transport factor 2 family protein [Saccharomonospora viridis]KHF43014.1 ketosteroid isomerase [Saccharomonospora viridis]SFO86422.1 Ketosteroid isomerase homolog [Saccharomonospora viridis]
MSGHGKVEREKAMRPEDLTRLFVERSNAGDAAGVAALYEEDAVLAYPPGKQTVGRAAIQVLWEKVLADRPHFEQETPLPTLISGDIALTSTEPKDGVGARAQVVRRQPDGSWLRVLDQPEFVSRAE